MISPVTLPVPSWLAGVATGAPGAPVALPVPRSVKIDKPKMLNWGGPLTPALGGAVQNIQRLGTRHALDITIPVMRAEPHGRVWASRLRQGLLYGVVAPYRQDGFAIGLPGAPTVNGAGQAGSMLAMSGFRPGYAVREGQAFTLLSGGQLYLHFAAADTVAASDGSISLPIFPMLRVIPNSGDLCHFGQPYIQGNLSGNSISWTRLAAPYCDFGMITITENA